MENHFCTASIQILVYENLESGYTEMGWVVVVCNFRSLSNEKTEAVLFCIYLYNYQLVRFQKQSWSLVRLLPWKDISCWYLNSLFKEEIILIFYYIYMYTYTFSRPQVMACWRHTSQPSPWRFSVYSVV